jgi:hypothetical protein
MLIPNLLPPSPNTLIPLVLLLVLVIPLLTGLLLQWIPKASDGVIPLLRRTVIGVEDLVMLLPGACIICLRKLRIGSWLLLIGTLHPTFREPILLTTSFLLHLAPHTLLHLLLCHLHLSFIPDLILDLY